MLAQPKLWMIGEDAKNPLFSDVAPREMIRERRYEKVRQSVVAGIEARMTGSPVEKHAAGIVPAMIEHRRGDIAQLCERYGSASSRCLAPFCVATLTRHRAT